MRGFQMHVWLSRFSANDVMSTAATRRFKRYKKHIYIIFCFDVIEIVILYSNKYSITVDVWIQNYVENIFWF